MKYIDVITKISDPIFSLQDLRLMGIQVYPYQISKWIKNGYIRKIKNGLFLRSDKSSEVVSEHIAFQLYAPSYISLEWALSYYGIIPEMVYALTSLSPKTTRIFENDFGTFTYHSVKKEMFFGYVLSEKNGLPFRIAEPEKAVLDYFYFNSKVINNIDDMRELRLNDQAIKSLDHAKMLEYIKLVGGRKLNRVYKLLLKVYA